MDRPRLLLIWRWHALLAWRRRSLMRSTRPSTRSSLRRRGSGELLELLLVLPLELPVLGWSCVP